MGGQEPCEFSTFGVLFSKHRAKAENRMFFCFFTKCNLSVYSMCFRSNRINNLINCASVSFNEAYEQAL